MGELIKFVKAAEAAAKAQGSPEGRPVVGFGPAEAAPILNVGSTSFAARWTGAIDSLNKYAPDRYPGMH